MRKIAILSLACAVLCPAALAMAQAGAQQPGTRALAGEPAGGPQPQPLPPPQISPSEGAAAVSLARQAMLDYLRNRTPAESVQIPAPAEPLTKKTGAAAVTLRSEGAEVGRAIRQEQDLSGSIIASAQAAMRSPRLADKVTPEYLAGLVVEVEILGPPQKVEEANLPAAAASGPAGATRAARGLVLAADIVPGLTGVTASRGLDDYTILPSASYVRSMPADDIPRECLAGLPLTAASASLSVRWTVFSSSHHVGFPDGKVVWLRQGRTPLPAEMLDPRDLAAAPGSIGLFLLRNQGKDGQFALPDANAETVDQLYATFAMARLAKAGGRSEFLGGLNAGLKWAARRVQQEASFAFVEGVTDEEQLSALSFLVLTIGETPPNPQTQELCHKLLATVDKALAQRSASEAVKTVIPMKGLALAYLASSRAEPNNTQRLDSLRKSIASAPGRDSAVCWLIRAGLLEQHLSTATAPAPTPAAMAQDTVVAALSAVNLAEGKSWPELALPASPAEAQQARRAMVLAAKRFCRQMQYRPYEAYFKAKPDLWLGGVRASPRGARVTLESCAAAIEALLAE